jgi:hypothetical protein
MILARLLSRTLSQREGDPTSAERFLELRQGEGDQEDDRAQDVDEPARDENEENRDTQETRRGDRRLWSLRHAGTKHEPKIRHDTQYYEKMSWRYSTQSAHEDEDSARSPTLRNH